MRMSTRGLTIVALVAGCPFDPETPEFEVITDSETDSTSGGTTPSTTNDPSGDPTTVDPDTTDGPSTTAPSTTVDPTEDPTTETGPDAVCGDGSIDGDEVCDDGTNDGSYGGCMPGCGALAPYCGDSEITDDEVCDDGTNDGSYGGCAAACDALGPYCGDGSMDGPEQCDNGDKNQNATGCNIDCVISGSVMGSYLQNDLSFCDGTFITAPAFRDGNTLVAVTGYCDDDDVVLAEFNPAVEQVQEYDGLLLPQTPVREATVAGDTWVLSSSGCSYAISPMGELTEACMPRITGDDALAGREDGSYVALDYEALGQYPAGSPVDGDTPDWSVLPPDNGTYDYTFSNIALGESDSTIVVGYRRYIPNNTYTGYLARYTAAGNAAGSSSFPQQYIYEVAANSTGDIVVSSGYPEYRLMHLGDDFYEDWGYDVPSSSTVNVGVDSTGAVVFAYVDEVSGNGVLRKWSPDGVTEYWSIQVPVAGYNSGLSIAPDDSIWVSTATFNGYAVARIAP